MHVSEVSQPLAGVNVSALLAGGGPEFGHQVSGHPAAVLYLNTLCPGPLADLGGVQAARRPAALTYGASASRQCLGQRIRQHFPAPARRSHGRVIGSGPAVRSGRRLVWSAERDELQLDVVGVPEHHRGVGHGFLLVPDAGV